MNFEDAIKKIEFLVKNEDYLIVKTLGNNSEFKIKVEDNKIKVVNSGDSSILVDKMFWDKVVYRMSLLEEDKKYKGTYYTITHWSHPENPNTLFSPTIPAIIRKLEGKEKIDSVLKNSKNNNLKYVIAIAIISCLLLFFKVLHEDSVKENDVDTTKIDLLDRNTKFTNNEISGIYKGSNVLGEINGRQLSDATELTILQNGTFVANIYENGSQKETIKGTYNILFNDHLLKDAYGKTTGHRYSHGINFLFPNTEYSSGDVVYGFSDDELGLHLTPLAIPPIEGMLPEGIDSNTRPLTLTKQ